MAITNYSDVAGLTGHWEAQEEVGLNDGDGVATITDQTTNSNNLTAVGSTSERPTYKTSIINSKAVYRFDGVDDHMEALNILATTTISDVTVFSVYQTSSTQNRERPYGFGSRDVDTDSASKIHLNMAPDPSLRFDGAAITSYDLAHPTTFFVRVTRKNSTNYEEWFDGTAAITSQPASVADGGIVDDFYMGQCFDPTAADIALILVYNSALSTADRTDVQNLINDNYFPTGAVAQMNFWNGAAWTAGDVKYWNGSAWTAPSAVKEWNGSAWVQVSP